jgi:hypothetical protein
MSDVTGTLKKVTLDGVTYNVPGDIDVTEMGSGFENSLIPTSGLNILKQVKVAEIREGVVLIVNDTQMDLLTALAENQVAIPMSYKLASGTIKRATGWIQFTNRTTAENRATLILLPQGEWSTFSV